MNPKLAPLVRTRDGSGPGVWHTHRECADLAPHIDALIEAASAAVEVAWITSDSKDFSIAEPAFKELLAALAFFQEGSESDEAIATQARHDPAPSQDAPAG